jgi:hypothetical protein
MTVRRLFLLLAALMLLEGVAVAQSIAGNDFTTISYSVDELVFDISPQQKADQYTTSENKLIARIREKVAPATWEQAGGSGRMWYEWKGFVLHVYQTPAVHAELQSFLRQLQRGEVSVETRIVLVSGKTLEEMERYRINWTKKDGIESAVLNDLQLYRFLESVQGDRRAHVMQMPKITMYEGQEAKVQATISRVLVTGVDFKEKDGTPVAVPKNEQVDLGPQARYLATIATDRRHVTLQAEVSMKSLAEPVPTGAVAQPASFNDIKVAVTAKVPDERTVAIMAGTILLEEIREEYSPLGRTLGRIPYLSRLCRTVGYSRESARQIVLVTPRIVREQETVDVQPLRTKIEPENDGKFPLILSQGN